MALACMSLISRTLHHPSFSYYPSFFSLSEQRVLLRTALAKLDALDSRQLKIRRKAASAAAQIPSTIMDEFYSEDLYRFEEVCLIRLRLGYLSLNNS